MVPSLVDASHSRVSGFMEYRRRAEHYSALMLADLITLPHFSVSSAMSLPKSAGEPASAVPPRSASFTSSRFTSLDHLVGAAEQREGEGDAKRLGSLEVDDQFNLCDLLHGQVGRLLAFENPSGVDADRMVQVRKVASVAHQAAGRGEHAVCVNRWHPITERQCTELFAPAIEECISAYYQPPARNWTDVANTVSKSRSLLACRTWSCSRGCGPLFALHRSWPQQGWDWSD